MARSRVMLVGRNDNDLTLRPSIEGAAPSSLHDD